MKTPRLYSNIVCLDGLKMDQVTFENLRKPEALGWRSEPCPQPPKVI